LSSLRDTTLVDASVPDDAPVAEATRVISAVEVPAIAVVDRNRKVVGLFTSDSLLRSLFPAYLDEMEHTAFLEGVLHELEPNPQRSAARPVRELMEAPETIDLDADLSHVAARFLHSPQAALAVVDEGRFVGMLGQVEFCRTILRDAGM
jgi:CBS domain-containing protein